MPLIPDAIIGHEKQRGQLLHDIAHKNVAHAYLFSGPRHLGKATIARWFAWRLLCDHLPAEDAERTKQQVEKLIHPDFLSLDQLWIEEECDDWNEIGKTSNAPQLHRSKDTPAKSDVISIDDVRALSARLQSSTNAPYSVCFIRSIERMHVSATNAFLKILEEPPSRVVFILTAQESSALLPTLVSRTRHLTFAPLSAKNLSSLVTDESDDTTFALSMAQGAPGTLLRLLSDPDALREGKQIHAQARQFWHGQSLREKTMWLLALEKNGSMDDALLSLGLTLRSYHDPRQKAEWTKAYCTLLGHLKTNTHRGLILEQFALAVHAVTC